ncbi:sensor histidine kinase [Lentzea sp. NPDC051213]|uniref:sensor histidine kinase n=1 Tax=Lentzea sp. NPDC051213 TaxID=3364126 RepID=UPI0037AD0A39
MNTLIRMWDGLRTRPLVFDAALAVVTFAVPLLALAMGGIPSAGPDALTVAIGATSSAALVARRRATMTVLAITAVSAALLLGLSGARSPFLAPVVVAAYTVASFSPRARSWAAGAAVAALLASAVAVSVTGPERLWECLEQFAWIGAAVAFGDAAGSHRAYVAAVEERAKLAEHSREEEAARRVAEERLHIARELHDVVAHHIALVSVHSGVATHLLHSDISAVGQALGHVRSASATVLEELKTMLRVLRDPDELVADTDPARGISRIPELVDTFTASGTRVRLVTRGRPDTVPAAVELAAYRIVQESLTNAHKHAPDSEVSVLVAHDDELRIEVRNGPSGTARNSTGGGGHGLAGMRERVAAVGGTLDAGPEPSGGFTVVAVLPLRAGDHP